MMESQYLKDRLARLLGRKEPEPKKERTPIPKISAKKKKQLVEEKKTAAMDKEFYLEIWSSSPHACEECGRKLGKEPLTIFFHHLIPKSSHPEFRHTHENVMILCPDHHAQAETDLDKVPEVKARTEEVRKLLLQR
jgi:5-methylcytosine-specific restriction endonuclease McrA